MFMTPFDMVKQRMQLGFYKNVVDCVRSVVRSEGVRAMYVALPTTLMMNIPYGIVMVPVNESARKILNPSGQYNISASMAAGCLAGGVAGAVTNPLDVVRTRLQTQNLEPCPTTLKLKTVISHVHVDVSSAKRPPQPHISSTPAQQQPGTLLNKAGFVIKSSYYSTLRSIIRAPFEGMMDVSRRIWLEEGARGFLRGMAPRVMVQAPAVAISWTAYEGMKTVLAASDRSSSANSNRRL